MYLGEGQYVRKIYSKVVKSPSFRNHQLGATNVVLAHSVQRHFGASQFGYILFVAKNEVPIVWLAHTKSISTIVFSLFPVQILLSELDLVSGS